MKLTKRQLYRQYGISPSVYQHPIIYTFIVIGILLIDYFTSKITIDGIFFNSEESVNLLVTISICLVLDVVPLGVTRSLTELCVRKRKSVVTAITIAGFSVVLVTILFLGIERCVSASLLFGDDINFNSTSPVFKTANNDVQPYQIIIVLILTLVNIGTTLLGILITIERAKVQLQIDHALNCEDLADYKAALIELEQPSHLMANLKAERDAVCEEIDRIADEATQKAMLEISLLFDPRTVTLATENTEKENTV